MVPTGSSLDDYIEWALSSGSAVIGTYEDAIEQIENLQDLSNGGFGAFLLFDHNWANWNAKKHHYHLFGEYVIPHFKKTNRRLKSSELYARAVRDELAKAQSDAIGAFASKHAASAPKK
jgi:limonene 1,2-monooxygenase